MGGIGIDMISAAAQFAFDMAKRNADLQNENFRLRAALEKYADEYNWIGHSIPYGDMPWVRYLNGSKLGDGDLTKRPFEIAQKALEGKDE